MNDDPDLLGERLAHLEGVVEGEDRVLEKGLESARHAQMLLAAVVAIALGAAVAILVYLLNRMDNLSQQVNQPPAVIAKK